ncbi:bifunctional 2-polyprenyl-6-hydroxyphenol methylase/3-demethylubiquinol 3-O-methyltransferase UbiG [Methylophaga sp. OBS3]|uniref:bifunctional 2-polyprenyl-6-hydroxyphenol methylase/3-demethylubiquinol 3-O-methyltransferase UbiG n=1 Tax=Methylophaga sp. OBS3 TaxID=2991934 RepID=UPI0022542B02|nr:bifunctional 2-polyprenyl-6-hydroxyphenol methylase/3-demethylubiquinol 3-O-methyltransferase UbiG [Methylophaga sp. OBS3]MCX4190394.1 bifunctional 2-polyprenyl-6-hydroxyphenol methylase/3-demethylubiquinol 3-O-methyltransferase UbiG [Methylophaga sp. OBS3]
MTHQNVDPAEVAKFDALADSWWDPQGQSKPLHEINPHRLQFIRERTNVEGANMIDVGCGGGILTESLALSGAKMTGIDMGQQALEIAQLHALEAGLKIDYQHTTAEAMAAEHAGEFDAVTCMEMLEHVPDPQAIIEACASLVKPGGDVYFSTLNRHPKAWLLAIVGAEYIANMLPKGTHDYARFIKPSELSKACRQAGLSVNAIAGISYNPLSRQYSLTKDVDVNYLLHCRRL